jgi:hypothetical protein
LPPTDLQDDWVADALGIDPRLYSSEPGGATPVEARVDAWPVQAGPPRSRDAQDPARPDGASANTLNAGAQGGNGQATDAADPNGSSATFHLRDPNPPLTFDDTTDTPGSSGVLLASADPGFLPQAPRPQASPAQSAPPQSSSKQAKVLKFKVLVPSDCPSLDKMFRLFERVAFGKEVNDPWDCPANCRIEGYRGKQVEFTVDASLVEQRTDPADAQAQKQRLDDYHKTGGMEQAAIAKEADRRLRNETGDKPGAPQTDGEALLRDRELAGVMHDRELLQALPQPIKDMLFGKGPPAKPEDYAELLHIADKLKQFTPEDLALYQQLPLHPANDLKQFEDSIDLFLAHKDEIKGNNTQSPAPASGEPSMSDTINNEVWQGFDKVDVAHMSESDRYNLAVEKADEVSVAQFKYMAQHPGETLEGFAKSATLMNAPETLSAAGDDLAEAANGDANGWARFAGGAGAGAKLSGVALAALGVLYLASWATGIGEVATIAAAAGYMLDATLVLSLTEQQLRLKAASQATTPEELERQTNAAAAAQTVVLMTIAGMVTGAVVRFGAKALLPEIENIRSAIARFRGQIKAEVPLAELKANVAQEMATRRTALLKAATEAKAAATATAKQIDGMSLDQFVDWFEKNKSLVDSSSVPANQKVDFRELMKSDVGKKSITGLKQRLSNSLETHVVKQLDQLAQDHAASVDQFVAEVDKAASHEEVAAAVEKLDKSASPDHANELLRTEQEKLGKQLLQEASAAAQKEIFQKRFTEAVQKGDFTQAAQQLGQLDTNAQLKNLAGLDRATLSKMHAAAAKEFGPDSPQARASDPVHRDNLETDPAIGGKMRPNERDTALRTEQKVGAKLTRYTPPKPAPGQKALKGDWVDDNNKVYDGCSPAPKDHFDARSIKGFEASLKSHLTNANVDFVVVDLSELGLTPDQIAVVEKVIQDVAGPNNPKIVRIP